VQNRVNLRNASFSIADSLLEVLKLIGSQSSPSQVNVPHRLASEGGSGTAPALSPSAATRRLSIEETVRQQVVRVKVGFPHRITKYLIHLGSWHKLSREERQAGAGRLRRLAF
jgi:hypothetical protein